MNNKQFTFVVAMVCLVMTQTSLAFGQSETRPDYSPVLRQAEDWSVLSNREAGDSGDLFDPIKYVPLSDDESIWASFGGQVRLRYEDWSGFGFNNRNDDSFFLTRIRLHGDIHFGDQFRVFVEGKSAQSTDRSLPGARRGLDVDTMALQQAFGDVTLPLGDATVTLRGGRQMLLFGKQRLVSPLDWSNTMRAWDGFSGELVSGNLKVTGFWTQYVPVDKTGHNESNGDEQFYGAYATISKIIDNVNADLYWMKRDRDFIMDDRHTIGARVFGKLGESGFDYDVEGAYQTGDSGTSDVSAYMIGAQVGYTLNDLECRPRFFAGFDMGSGDNDPTDSDVNTFDQLYPLGHAYLGFIDVVGRQNILDANFGVSLKPLEKTTLIASVHFYSRDDEMDALYNAGGGVVRAGGAGTSSEVGSEIDLLLKHQLDTHTTILLGYSHFFAGEFVEDTGVSDDIDFFYTSVQFTF